MGRNFAEASRACQQGVKNQAGPWFAEDTNGPLEQRADLLWI